jgi:dUTP pyrophosphatase
MRIYYENGCKPEKTYEDDAGLDLRSKEEITIKPSQTVMIFTGVRAEIPNRNVGLVKGRSGLAKSGIAVLGGVVDAGYRGEIAVMLANLSDRDVQVRKGDRIGQLVVVPCDNRFELIEGVPKIDTARGEKGFGSSGA